MLEMVRECMLSALISTLFTEEVGCKQNHGEEQDTGGPVAKDPCLAGECGAG